MNKLNGHKTVIYGQFTEITERIRRRFRNVSVTSRERVCVYEPRRSKIGSSKDIVGDCKY